MWHSPVYIARYEGRRSEYCLGKGKHGFSPLVHPNCSESRLRNFGFKLILVSVFFLSLWIMSIIVCIICGYFMGKLYCVFHVYDSCLVSKWHANASLYVSYIEGLFIYHLQFLGFYAAVFSWNLKVLYPEDSGIKTLLHHFGVWMEPGSSIH